MFCHKGLLEHLLGGHASTIVVTMLLRHQAVVLSYVDFKQLVLAVLCLCAVWGGEGGGRATSWFMSCNSHSARVWGLLPKLC
jgi:hypothetical protein